jgi:HAD superfamily hydrolase (TIGR01490 family)
LKDKIQKLGIFDFCETLVSFQTADAFIDYVRKIEGTFFMRFLEKALFILIKVKLIAAFNKFFPDLSIGKRLKLLQLRGFTFEKLDNLACLYFRDTIKPNLIDPILEEMRKLAQQGYEICLVSAGYSIYLKYFACENHINHIISTEIAFNNNRCNGTMLGKDCINNEKVIRIKKYFADQNVDFHDSISFSDSITDLPLLLFAGQGVVISHNQSQKWCHQYNFKEIVWSRK